VIALEDVSKSFGSRVAVARTTLAVEKASTTALIGPSGCGKSTLLRMMVGLVRPDTGRIAIGGTPLDLRNLERIRHGIGYVIQDGGLFPHLSALENVTLVARYLKHPPDDVAARVKELGELMRIPRDALTRYPQELSGGQRQRVGLMRALMLDPAVLLLDEPLGALDPITRYELQSDLKSIFASLSKTVVLVTHDMTEARHFADQIVLMRAGQVVQRGTYYDLCARPVDPYVTEFMRAQHPPQQATAS
jgi:osmoprotectant transport system ATP-binding protein